MNYCYPFLPCSLGPLWAEPMALLYCLTDRNKMLTASWRHPRLLKLKSSTSAPQRQPLRVNAAAHLCNRIWRWTWLVTGHRNMPWNLLIPDFYLTINAAALAQHWAAACEKQHDWLSLLAHLTQCTCMNGTTESFQGISACGTSFKPERKICHGWCDSRVSIQTQGLLSILLWQTILLGVWFKELAVSHIQVSAFVRHSTHFFQPPGKRNVFEGVNDFDNSSAVC